MNLLRESVPKEIIRLRNFAIAEPIRLPSLLVIIRVSSAASRIINMIHVCRLLEPQMEFQLAKKAGVFLSPIRTEQTHKPI